MVQVHYRRRWWVVFGALNMRPLDVAKPGSARTAPDGRLNPFDHGAVEIFPGVFSNFRARPLPRGRCYFVTAVSTVLVVELA